MRHELKCWPAYFAAILAGTKTFEIRKNDRGFQVGDELLLKEWDPATEIYSGREIIVEVPYITTSCQAMPPSDFVVMSIKKKSYQADVRDWLYACFGEEIATDKVERSHRFLEEALELVQACGTTPDEARKLVDYTFSRPVGEKFQEVGGVMITLSGLCNAQGLDMVEAGKVELARVYTAVDKIRAKQKAKPKFGPLPQ
jgi:Domain of unknown function (DUF3850)